eukprot:JP439851.1.p4 GENE.JP439851.1~~JP439851.1.p4  ORF type:complete len:62 (+),score=1.70 JP439851.1:114-299(+)
MFWIFIVTSDRRLVHQKMAAHSGKVGCVSMHSAWPVCDVVVAMFCEQYYALLPVLFLVETL